MKFILIALLSLTLCACSQGTRITPSSDSQPLAGEISGYKYDSYQVSLNKGEKLQTLISSDKLDVVIFSPVAVSLSNDDIYTAPITATYTLRVLLPREQARRGESESYTLQVLVN